MLKGRKQHARSGIGSIAIVEYTHVFFHFVGVLFTALLFWSSICIALFSLLFMNVVFSPWSHAYLLHHFLVNTIHSEGNTLAACAQRKWISGVSSRTITSNESHMPGKYRSKGMDWKDIVRKWFEDRVYPGTNREVNGLKKNLSFCKLILTIWILPSFLEALHSHGNKWIRIHHSLHSFFLML